MGRFKSAMLAFIILAAAVSAIGCGKLWMTYNAFDRTTGSGWRTLADEGDYSGAARMIDSFAGRRKELAGWQLMSLRYHAGQMYACAGDYATAVERLESSLLKGGHAGRHSVWNLRVYATLAFLRGDLAGLKSYRDDIAAGLGPGGKTEELEEADLLIGHFGEPYVDAYPHHILR